MKPVKNDTPISTPLPSEGYASLVSTERQGKSATNFLRNPAMVMILVPGRSFTKAIQALPVRMKHLLELTDFAELIPSFALESETEK